MKGMEKLVSVLESYPQSTGRVAATLQTSFDANQAPITSPQNLNQMAASDDSHCSSLPNNDLDSALSEQTKRPTEGTPPTEISLFAAATESFSKANTNCTIGESLERCRPIIFLAKSKNIRVRGYISVALGCPYEGSEVSASKVTEIAASLLEMGVDEVSLADTTGMGTAMKTKNLLRAVSAAGIASTDIALHFHDTHGQALVNTVVALDHGIRTFDSSVGGLGGCPYSVGATGNVATEDLLHTLHGFGLDTGVDFSKMTDIGKWITSELRRPYESRAGKAHGSRK